MKNEKADVHKNLASGELWWSEHSAISYFLPNTFNEATKHNLTKSQVVLRFKMKLKTSLPFGP